MARNFQTGADWVPALVIRQLVPLTYLVEVKSQQCWKCHIDHLRHYTQPEERSGQEHDEDQDYYPPLGMQPPQADTTTSEPSEEESRAPAAENSAPRYPSY